MLPTKFRHEKESSILRGASVFSLLHFTRTFVHFSDVNVAPVADPRRSIFSVPARLTAFALVGSPLNKRFRPVKGPISELSSIMTEKSGKRSLFVC